jgi:hypothetical protein
MRKTFLRISLLGIAVAVGSLSAESKQLAQPKNGIITGIVVDSSRATIPGVTVTATNSETNVEMKLLTNESGQYRFETRPGSYKVTAYLCGFETATFSDVRVEDGQNVRINFALNLGPSNPPCTPIRRGNLPPISQ